MENSLIFEKTLLLFHQSTLDYYIAKMVKNNQIVYVFFHRVDSKKDGIQIAFQCFVSYLKNIVFL